MICSCILTNSFLLSEQPCCAQVCGSDSPMSRTGDLGPGFLTLVERLDGEIGSVRGDSFKGAAASSAACEAHPPCHFQQLPQIWAGLGQY